jgi:predicted MPP superfamily phosphohydrolase
MDLFSPQLCSILLYTIAGWCVFLLLLNRFLIQMPDGTRKIAIILPTFAVITCGSVAAGFFYSRAPFVYGPIAVLTLIFAGEVRRYLLRRSYAADGPVKKTPPKTHCLNPFTTTDVTTHSYEVRHSKWSGARLRIVHLTDLHVHRGLPIDYYKRVIRSAEEVSPDLAFFTGDFVTRADSLPILREILRPIGKAGSFAVLGNHDYWADPRAVGAIVTEKGLHLLTNNSQTVSVGGQELVITGCNYPWRIEKIGVPAQKQGILHLALSHTPDNVYRLSKLSANFVFSGHYHAGQFRLPLIGSLVIPSIYGRRFDHGHFMVNGTHLFVGSGVGAANPPLRIYCRPDIFVVDIFGENGTSLGSN